MNIVFDLGGVVVRWEPDAIIAGVFADLQERALVRREVIGHPDWIALDRGTLPRAEAIARAARRTGLPEAQVETLLDRVPPALTAIPETVALMYRLKERGHALYCLSNMHAEFIAHLEREYAFFEVFSGSAVSCRLGLCKPEPAIYAHLLDSYGLAAGETLFIDDVPVNLAAAAEFGIRTIRFEDPAQCERRLRELCCL